MEKFIVVKVEKTEIPTMILVDPTGKTGEEIWNEVYAEAYTVGIENDSPYGHVWDYEPQIYADKNVNSQFLEICAQKHIAVNLV